MTLLGIAMCHRCVTLLALSLVSLAAVLRGQDAGMARCSRPPTAFARVLANNDISLADPPPSSDSEPLPAPVQAKIDALASEACFGIFAHTNDSLSLAVIYGPIFRIRAPSHQSLYVFERFQTAPPVPVWYLILFDSASGKVTSRPPAIFGKWMDSQNPELRRPLISFDDLDHDGRPEVTMMDWSHNGTVYNAAVRHYYAIDEGLELEPVLALETKAFLDIPPRPTFVMRSVHYIAKDTLRIDAFLSQGGAQSRPIGHVFLVRNQTFGYHVGRRNVVNPAYGPDLITSSGENDNSFLLDGYTFWY